MLGFVILEKRFRRFEQPGMQAATNGRRGETVFDVPLDGGWRVAQPTSELGICQMQRCFSSTLAFACSQCLGCFRTKVTRTTHKRFGVSTHCTCGIKPSYFLLTPAAVGTGSCACALVFVSFTSLDLQRIAYASSKSLVERSLARFLRRVRFRSVFFS